VGWHLSQSPSQMPLALPAACTVACLILFWLILYDLDHPAVLSANPAPRESPLGRWRRHHRLARLPGTIEVETCLLFLAPLVGSAWLLRASFVAASAYYLVASVHLFVKLFRRTSPPTAPLPDDPPSQIAS